MKHVRKNKSNKKPPSVIGRQTEDRQHPTISIAHINTDSLPKNPIFSENKTIGEAKIISIGVVSKTSIHLTGQESAARFWKY